jgi:WD40 repeat protein
VWRLHPEHKHKQLTLSRTLPAHAAHVTALAHAWSYSLLVTAAADGSVSFYDLHSLSMQRRLPQHPFPVRCVCIDPYRGEVVTAAGPHLYVWDVNGGLVAQHLGPLSDDCTIESVVWTTGPEGAWIEPNIITGHRDGSIRIWRLVYPSAPVNVQTSPDLAAATPADAAASAAAAAVANSNSRRRSMNLSQMTLDSVSSKAATARARTSSMADMSSYKPHSGSFSSSTLNSPLSPASGAGGSPMPLASFPLPDTTSSVNGAPCPGSLGRGFLGLEQCHRLDTHSLHDGAAVSALHCSVTDWKRLWSGDRSGRVVAWQLSSEEHWRPDAERISCTTCQTKFTVLERRHRQYNREC